VRGLLDQAQARAEGVRFAVQVREAELSGARADADRAGVAVEHAQGSAYALDNRVQLLEGQLAQRRERLAGLEEAERVAERELSELETQRAALSDEREHIARALAELEQAEHEAASLFESEQAELASRREAATEAESVLTAARARVSEAAQRIARAEAVLTGFERRKAQERQRLEQLTSERESAEVRRVEVGQELSALEVRLTGLRSGSQATQAKKDEIESELRALREQIQGSEQDLTALREETAERRSRLRSLEELASRFEGVGAGVRALLTQYAPNDEARRERGLLGLAFDLIECPERYTQALAGALGDELSRVVVEDGEAALSALSFLREEDRGRAAFMPRRMRGVAGARVRLPEGEGVIGRLADLVHAQPGHEELVRRLLSGVIVVDSLEHALSLSRDAQDELRVVTLEGEVVEPTGVLRGGAHDDVAAHMLQVRREIRSLHEVVAELEEKLSAAVTRHGELRRGIAERQAAIDAARNEAHDAEIAIVKADKDLRRHAEERQRVEARIAKLGSEIEALELLLEEAGDEEAQARQEIESARAAELESTGAQRAAEAICQSRREAVDAQQARVSDVRVRAAQARERAESDRGAVRRLGRSIEELGAREERLRGDVLTGARQQGETLGRILRESEELSAAISQAMAAHSELEGLRVVHDERRSALFDEETRLRELRVALDEESRRAAEQELRERELSLAMEHLLEQMQDRHDLDLRRVLGDYHDRPLPDASVKARVDELLRLISRMGEINLMAIEEYEEKSTRFEYLSAQQQDLEEALTKLERAIRQMNRESKALFREAFVAVNERFKLIFPQLFRGGKAELKLTDPNDLLESGIDIVAQPPGKRVGALELMSGGEKALTAVAMIFAIFQYKPSPFCLLDEVDAPLDEANIGRFADAIRQMTDRSQFIVITHSKRTMETVDVLYGVTMEQPGVSKLVSVELRGEHRPQKGAPQDAVAVA
ncbi:MAG: chromosome segregation protein SMC, partial [Deltaproteobacteria bacterium]|nr:chromosome segregation protein SMC [Deltaproteobacteria bacterium]